MLGLSRKNQYYQLVIYYLLYKQQICSDLVFDLLLFLFLKDVETHQRKKEYEIINGEVNLDERI